MFKFTLTWEEGKKIHGGRGQTARVGTACTQVLSDSSTAEPPGLEGKEGRPLAGLLKGALVPAQPPPHNRPVFICQHRAESFLPPSLKGLLLFPFPFQAEAEGQQPCHQRRFHP